MSDSDEQPSDGKGSAEKRTDWSEDRTILANERTFAAWTRTGAALLAVAVGLNAVFPEAEPPWLAKATATIFVAAAVLVFAASARQSVKAQMRIDSHLTATQPSRRMIILAVMLTSGALATGALLWII